MIKLKFQYSTNIKLNSYIIYPTWIINLLEFFRSEMCDSEIKNILNDGEELDYIANEPTCQVITTPPLRKLDNRETGFSS